MYQPYFKPVLDMAASIILLPLCLPVFFTIFLLVGIDSSGPAFFRQKRLGKHKKEFRLIKFRTMLVNAPKDGQAFPGDHRVTRVGRVLRRFKLDELPQVINVLYGDMSFVGPRPCLLSTLERFGDQNSPYRFNVKPGITSNGAVSGGIYLSWPEKWRMDRAYVENVCLKKDLWVLLKTALVVLLGEARFTNRGVT